jgi:pimeloyl-ACP methyl ester carboxylesterase
MWKRSLLTRKTVSPEAFASRLFSQHLMAYEIFGSKETSQTPTHAIGFLHGIMGNKKNWRTPAKTFIRQHPEYAAFAADLRGHGDSGLLSLSTTAEMKKNTVHSCALDLQDILLSKPFQQKFPQLQSSSPSGSSYPQERISNYSNLVLAGHSFGGKVLLEFLKMLHDRNFSPSPASSDHHQKQQHGTQSIAFTSFILDSIPDFFDPTVDDNLHQHHSVNNILSIVEAAPKVYSTKQQALDYLQVQNGLNPMIAQWLLMNLEPVLETSSGSSKNPIKEWRYSFDIQGIVELFDNFKGLSYLDFLENFNMGKEEPTKKKGKIVFVRSGKNPFWKHNSIDERLQAICQKNPHVVYVTMPHVGHWLHSEDLLGMLKLMSEHLPKE